MRPGGGPKVSSAEIARCGVNKRGGGQPKSCRRYDCDKRGREYIAGRRPGLTFAKMPGGFRRLRGYAGTRCREKVEGRFGQRLRSKSCHREIIEEGGQGGVRNLVS